MRRTLHTAVLLTAGATLAGCYSYVPVQSPAPRTEVRATVPVSTGVQGGPASRMDSYALEGRVVSSGDTLVLETESRSEFGAFREVSRVDTVRVATASLLALDERVFSRPKTIGLTAVLVGGTVALAAAIISVATGSENGGTNGPPIEGQIRLDGDLGALVRLLAR